MNAEAGSIGDSSYVQVQFSHLIYPTQSIVIGLCHTREIMGIGSL